MFIGIHKLLAEMPTHTSTDVKIYRQKVNRAINNYVEYGYKI